jgi:hypothetical protein
MVDLSSRMPSDVSQVALAVELIKGGAVQKHFWVYTMHNK